MPLTVIEIHDAGLRVLRDGRQVCVSPGVALVENGEVLVGKPAHARALLNPRTVSTRFWQQLNELPLPQKSRQARHHADLAYHHLKAVLDEAGNPEDAILAVPSNFTEQQLALLLGIAGACGLRVGGLVDASVAALAGVAPPGDYVLADLFQHHAVVCRLHVDDRVSRQAVDTLDQPGLARLYEACVDLIADAFLEQSRFDPLHEAATEQLLHTHLPDWLGQAASGGELDLAIDYQGTRFHARIPAREIVRVTEMVVAPIGESVRSGVSFVMAPWLARLPGVTASLGPGIPLSDDAVYRGIAEHRLAFGTGAEGVAFVTELPAAADPQAAFAGASRTAEQVALAPTHLLAGATAKGLGEVPVYLRPDGSIAHLADGLASCSVVIEAAGATLRVSGADATVNGQPVLETCTLSPGDRIVLDGGRAVFVPIRVEE